MKIYLYNIIFVIILAFVESKFNKSYQRHIHKKKVIAAKIFLICIPVFILMTAEMGLRGDFTQDVLNYHTQFNTITNWSAAMDHNKNMGYNAVMAFFHQYSNRYLYFLVFLATIMSSSLIIFFWKEARLIWLSLLTLFCSGVFYTGFNIMREYLAFTLFTLCIGFIYKRKIILYTISVLIISSIHLSAIFMLPVYFLPRLKWKSFDKTTIILTLMLVTGAVYLFMGNIINAVTSVVYEEYNSNSAYGMAAGTSIESTFKAIAISLFALLNLDKFNKNDDRDMLIYNGCIFYVFFALCGFKVYMLQRLTMYFSAFLMMAYPLIISRISSLIFRRNAILFLCILLIASISNILFSSNYYFYWDNVRYDW